MAEAAAKSDSVQFNKPRARDCCDEIDIPRLPWNKKLRPEGNHSRSGAKSVSVEDTPFKACRAKALTQILSERDRP
jgi:hypothetical protein